MRNQDDGILYDFPCSYTFRAYEAELYGRDLPHLDIRQKPPQDVEVRHTYFHIDNSRRITAKLNAMDGAVRYLLGKEEQKGVKKGRYLG